MKLRIFASFRWDWSPERGGLRRQIAALLSAALVSCGTVEAERRQPGVNASTLAVIVNDQDPLSGQISAYYRVRRGIPSAHVIHVSLPTTSAISRQAFELAYEKVKRETPDDVQAYVLTWTTPYRVDCMSITSAFALGFDPAWCATGCKTTRHSPYYRSSTDYPFTDTGVRPTMMLAAESFRDAKALIERGVASDFSMPQSKGWVLKTADKARSVRSWQAKWQLLDGKVQLAQQSGERLYDTDDIMFYFTGTTTVKDIDKLNWLPGGVGDHLTSYGGVLDGSGQMSSLKWLQSGATGSYGTVVEPCNFGTKFPQPVLMARRYVTGATLLEAYWNSVGMPGQGVFIGEPLARPFATSPTLP